MISNRDIFLQNTQYMTIDNILTRWRLNIRKCVSVCVCLSVCDMISFLAGWINIYRSTFSSKSILINRRSVNTSTSYFFLALHYLHPALCFSCLTKIHRFFLFSTSIISKFCLVKFNMLRKSENTLDLWLLM